MQPQAHLQPPPLHRPHIHAQQAGGVLLRQPRVPEQVDRRPVLLGRPLDPVVELGPLGQPAGYGYYDPGTLGQGDLDAIVQTLQNGGAVIAGTGTADTLSTGVLVDQHAYTVVDVVQQNGTTYVLMRNPWGVDGGLVTCGNKSDGIVWVTWDDFSRSMGYLAVVG